MQKISVKKKLKQSNKLNTKNATDTNRIQNKSQICKKNNVENDFISGRNTQNPEYKRKK